MPSRSEKVTFPGSDGYDLSGRLDLPVGLPKAYALWAHCFSCTKDIFAASRVSNGLTERGIAVLRFDFTGLGESDGDFANTNFSSNVDDLVAAADFMRETFEAPKLLVGHSLGGAAVLAAASRIPESEAVCTIAAPADPEHVAHNFESSREEIEANGEAEVLLAGRPFKVKKQFLDDISSQKLDTHIARLKRALLVCHSPTDQIVGIENATAIYLAAKHPKSFLSLDGADHLLSRKRDAIYVADVISAWASRYISLHEEAPGWKPAEAPPGTVLVEETGEGKFGNRISVGGKHVLLADEPKDIGGLDKGPTPYDLLLAALGACKTMTMRMYADRKGFPLERASVQLTHDRIHAKDCETCETETGHVDRIQVEVHVEGDMDDETRRRIVEIAERCPVHKTLQSEVLIETKHDA